MRISRRSLMAGAGALGTAALLGACEGGDGPKAGAGSEAPPGSLSGEVTVLTPAFTTTEAQQVFTKIVADFNKVYPDVKVTPDFSDYSKLNEKLTASIAGAIIPDVIMSGIGWVEPFADKGIYAEFDSSVTEDLDYVPEILGPCTYQDKLYALPILLDTRGMIGNRKLWDAVGVSEAPTSFEDFRSLAAELTSGSQYGVLISGSPRQVFATMLGAAGGAMFSEDGSTPQFTSPESVRALECMVGLIEDGSTAWDYKPAEGSPHPFLSGKLGMSLFSSVDWQDWNEAEPDLLSEEGSILFSNTDQRDSNFLGGTLVSRSLQSKNPEAADAFVKALAGEQAVTDICEDQIRVPPLPGIIESSDVLKDNRFIENGVKTLEFASYEGGTAAWMDIRGQLDPILEEALLGKTPVDAALEKADAMAQDAIDRL